VSAPSERLHRRAAEVRARALERAWRHLQRGRASGVWDRLRRVLADAESAYAVSSEVMDDLVARGHAPHPVGLELAPAKRLVFLTGEEAASLPGARRVEVRLTAPVLAALDVVLVPFR
jgi:hypothetical protein